MGDCGEGDVVLELRDVGVGIGIGGEGGRWMWVGRCVALLWVHEGKYHRR